MMEFFLHYITADIKYNFWCEEDGHQFREDWVKCRINIKYLDSPNIQISCYPVNHYETIPLNVDINFADFRFEKAVEMNGTKTNVFALLWTQHNQTSEFFIAIDNDTQFKNYESYLNNLVKICRIAENERLDAQSMEPSSISYQNVGCSSLSLFSTSGYETEGDHIGSTELISKKENGKRRFGLSRVKNVTKCAAKKFNRIFVKAKSKLKKPSFQTNIADISISSSSTQLTDIDDDIFYKTADEFEEIDLNNVSRCSSRSSMFVDDWNCRHANEEHRFSNDSLNSISTSNSSVGLYTSSQSMNSLNSSISSTNSSLIHQIVAESIADLNMICAQNEMPIVKLNQVKKVMRKGTPYKLKMPKRLTLYEEDFHSLTGEEMEVKQEEEITSKEDEQYDFCTDAVDLLIEESTNENNVKPKINFIQKESFGKRVVIEIGKLWKTWLKNNQTIIDSATYYHYV